MFSKFSPHLLAVLQATLVTFLWSTSWVLIKFGLQDIPALTFAGLRYGLAFALLLPFALRAERLQVIRNLTVGEWVQILGLGCLFYTLTQGAQFVSLFYLPAITTNLLLSFSGIVVAVLSIFLLQERPSAMQWLGVGCYLCGVLIYFYPVTIPLSARIGLAVALAGVLANSLSSILGRHVNRSNQLKPIEITVVSMGFGAFLLLLSGITLQGMPKLTWMHWGLILWLAGINTAFAFTLWNHTLKTLSATESSILNSLMLIQIPLLAYLFLNETVNTRELVGLICAGIGILIVQLRTDL